MDVMSNNSSLSCWSSVAYPDPVPTFKWTDNNAMSRTQSIVEYFHMQVTLSPSICFRAQGVRGQEF